MSTQEEQGSFFIFVLGNGLGLGPAHGPILGWAHVYHGIRCDARVVTLNGER